MAFVNRNQVGQIIALLTSKIVEKVVGDYFLCLLVDDGLNSPVFFGSKSIFIKWNLRIKKKSNLIFINPINIEWMENKI